MSMIHSHPVLDPNAQAKAMIDAVTGHQPSPLDSEYSSKHQQHLNRKPARKTSNLVGTKTSSTRASNQAAGGFAQAWSQVASVLAVPVACAAGRLVFRLDRTSLFGADYLHFDPCLPSLQILERHRLQAP
jgi:hypothetical protein